MFRVPHPPTSGGRGITEGSEATETVTEERLLQDSGREQVGRVWLILTSWSAIQYKNNVMTAVIALS